jgi:cytochrome oxidase Cu insertion factor (SCO1/SenC/PrrC family)
MKPETVRNVVMGALAAGAVVIVALSIVPRGARDGDRQRPAATADGKTALDDRLFDLQLVPLEGRTPPAFTLDAFDGGRVSLADFRGRPVLIYFWASW